MDRPPPRMTDGLCLVHLVWAPLGPSALGRFIDSYRSYSPGTEHELLVVMKGFEAGADREPWRELLAGLPHSELEVKVGQLDLGSYRGVVDRVPRAERFCFTNSSSAVLADGWLQHIERQLQEPGVGLVGTAGSFESAYSAAPRPLRPLRRDFDPFPNAHIRTNGFALTREILLSLDWPAPRRKLQALRLESGRHGISRQVRDRGLRILVVGRDAVGYPSERWRESATFRSGAQVNQLIADNRTRQYDQADVAMKRRLEQLAWGPAS